MALGTFSPAWTYRPAVVARLGQTLDLKFHMPSPTTPESKSNILPAKYWLGPYAIVVSSLYLWGYWGAFEVNILEYIGISEIVKAAIYPIASAFAFFAIGAVLGEALSPTLHVPQGGGANTTIGKLLRRLAPFLLTAYLLAVTLLFLAGPVEKWRALPVLFATVVYLPLKSTSFLRTEFESEGARSIAVFLIAALVPFAYGQGVLEANDVLEAKKFAYSVAELPGIAVSATAKPDERPRYVGKANDRYVFYGPVGKSTSFVATSELKTLTLKRHGASSSASVVITAGGSGSTSTSRPASTPVSASSPAKGPS